MLWRVGSPALFIARSAFAAVRLTKAEILVVLVGTRLKPPQRLEPKSKLIARMPYAFIYRGERHDELWKSGHEERPARYGPLCEEEALANNRPSVDTELIR